MAGFAEGLLGAAAGGLQGFGQGLNQVGTSQMAENAAVSLQQRLMTMKETVQKERAARVAELLKGAGDTALMSNVKKLYGADAPKSVDDLSDEEKADLSPKERDLLSAQISKLEGAGELDEADRRRGILGKIDTNERQAERDKASDAQHKAELEERRREHGVSEKRMAAAEGRQGMLANLQIDAVKRKLADEETLRGLRRGEELATREGQPEAAARYASEIALAEGQGAPGNFKERKAQADALVRDATEKRREALAIEKDAKGFADDETKKRMATLRGDADRLQQQAATVLGIKPAAAAPAAETSFETPTAATIAKMKTLLDNPEAKKQFVKRFGQAAYDKNIGK